ncbi:substrate-binding domain-containing protein [Gordonia sp. (in: high G+C Gram-positive bacteria)]|uniref:substrate-binding domain-containing protein n=1 Tax=Gordonia sp. (in: high G+C Gram-positive bacteria) TaxID=84139 RepID=UPI003F95741B
MGRHVNNTDGGASHSTGLRVGVSVALVAVLAIGVYVVWDSTRASCDKVEPVSVIAEGDLADYVSELADQTEQSSCFDFTVEAIAASHVADRLAGSRTPDIWVAESQSRIRQVGTALGHTWSGIGPSIGTSPIVVAGRDLPKVPSWSKVLATPPLRVDSPATSDVSNAAVVGALAEMSNGSMTHTQLIDTLTGRALRMNDEDGAPDLATMAADDGTSLALVSERAYATFAADAGAKAPEITAPGITATVPETGTVALDYRVANVAPSGRAVTSNDAIMALADTVKSDDGARIRSEHHVRPADGSPLPDGEGVGEVTMIDAPDRAFIDNIGRKWTALTRPIRALVVQDVSGSMRQDAGGRSRAALLKEASVYGLRKLPKNTALGYWEFSIDRGGSGTPYREVAPIAPVLDKTDGVLNRDVLTRAIDTSLTNLGGGTGLYDTALAAFKKVYDTYDPAYSNSVILMTDGRNEDPHSISLDQLVSELNIMKNPARRIPIVTIGISDDADADALERISEATRGSTFVAHDPKDIGSILLKAVSYRVEDA